MIFPIKTFMYRSLCPLKLKTSVYRFVVDFPCIDNFFHYFFKAIFQQSMFDTGGCSTSSPGPWCFSKSSRPVAFDPTPWPTTRWLMPWAALPRKLRRWDVAEGFFRHYHLVMTNSLPWKDPPFLIGKPCINGPFPMAMLNNQRVYSFIQT